MKRVIGVVSGKGGAGKTTVTLNLASAFLSLGEDVIIIDADLKMCGASLQLGMHAYPITLNEVLNNNINFFDAIYKSECGIKVVPASFFTEPASYLALPELLSELDLECIILVDSPPGIEDNAVEVLRACNEFLLVVNPDFLAVADAIKVFALAKELNVKPIGIVINKYSKKIKNQMKIEEIKSTFELPILSVIPEDEIIRKSVNARLPAFYLSPNSKSSLAFKEAAMKILGIPCGPKQSIFTKFFSFFR